MTVSILEGDCRDVLRGMADESVQTCVTSPPYFGLRDYGVDGQIGLEDTPELFIEQMVGVFREVRRVLRRDGTLWLNLGDSYAGDRGGGSSSARGNTSSRRRDDTPMPRNDGRFPGFKPKDLMGMPWRVALALQADGWWLRQCIVWHKPNPMPESARDRCTTAHEFIFLLSRNAGRPLVWRAEDSGEWSATPNLGQELVDEQGERRPRWISFDYYFDAEAIAEPRASQHEAGVAGWASGDVPHDAVSHNRASRLEQGAYGEGKSERMGRGPGWRERGDAKTFRGGQYVDGQKFANSHATERTSTGNKPPSSSTRNKRSVWTVATQPFAEAHFATFPPALVEPCILAGSPVGGVVLDPFGGAGTTGLVADRLGRDAVLVELNPDYAALARARIDRDRWNASKRTPSLFPHQEVAA